MNKISRSHDQDGAITIYGKNLSKCYFPELLNLVTCLNTFISTSFHIYYKVLYNTSGLKRKL